MPQTTPVILPPWHFLKSRKVSDYTYSQHAEGWDDCLVHVISSLKEAQVQFVNPPEKLLLTNARLTLPNGAVIEAAPADLIHTAEMDMHRLNELRVQANMERDTVRGKLTYERDKALSELAALHQTLAKYFEDGRKRDAENLDQSRRTACQGEGITK